jgi:hypothetical protein
MTPHSACRTGHMPSVPPETSRIDSSRPWAGRSRSGPCSPTATSASPSFRRSRRSRPSGTRTLPRTLGDGGLAWRTTSCPFPSRTAAIPIRAGWRWRPSASSGAGVSGNAAGSSLRMRRSIRWIRSTGRSACGAGRGDGLARGGHEWYHESVSVRTCKRDTTITRPRYYSFVRKAMLASWRLFTIIKKGQDRVSTTIRLNHQRIADGPYRRFPPVGSFPQNNT